MYKCGYLDELQLDGYLWDDDSNNELRIFLNIGTLIKNQKQQYVSFSSLLEEGKIYENI